MSTDNDSSSYFVQVRGKIIGPFRIDQLRSLRDRGRLQGDHRLSTDRRNWRPASDLTSLFGSQEAVPATQSLPVGQGTLPVSGEQGGWYLVAEGQQRGPLPYAHIQELVATGRLKPNDQVWTDGFSDWQDASEIPGLFPEKEATPLQRAAGIGVEAHQHYKRVASSKLWDGILNTVRSSMTARDLESICRALTGGGGWAMAISMLAGPGILIYTALKIDSVRVGLFGVGTFFGLAILKYLSERMCTAAHALVQASPNRLSSTSFLDTAALCQLALGVAFAVSGLLAAIDAEEFHLRVSCFASAAFFLVTFGYSACVLLHPSWLSIDCSRTVRAGEEGVGVAALQLKLALRIAPFCYGVGSILGAAGLVIAFTLLLVGDRWVVAAYGLATVSGGTIAIAGLLPLFAYLLAISLFVGLDLVQSILVLPGKLDALARSDES